MAIFDRAILYVSGRYLTISIWRFGKLKMLNTYQNDEAGYAKFDAFLNQIKQVNIEILVDAIEEDYRQEILPHVIGSDRRILIDRKLNQIYRGMDFRSALFIKREIAQRKNDHFLFIGLQETENLKAWLKLIELHRAPLKGVYLISMLSQALLKSSKFHTTHILLCDCLSNGFRQTYLYQGHLRISRLVPYPVGTSLEQKNVPFNFYLEELEKVYGYLLSQRLITLDDALFLCIPTRNHEAEVLVESISKSQKLPCYSLAIKDIQKNLELALIQKTPEFLYMDLLRKATRLNSLAPNILAWNYQINRIRRSFTLASLFILLVGIFCSMGYILTDLSTQHEIQQTAQETKIQLSKYQQVAKNFPVSPYPSRDLKTMVNLHEEISYYQRSPERYMQVLSDSLMKLPQIQINRLHWIQTSDVKQKESQSDTQLAQSGNDQTLVKLSKLAGHRLYELGFMTGEIKRFNGDYRAALALVNLFIEHLKANKDVEYVELIQAPVNVSSYANLVGSTIDEIESRQSVASFRIKLILKPRETK